MIRLLAAAVVIQGISLMLLWRSLRRQVDELRWACDELAKARQADQAQFRRHRHEYEQ